MTKIEIYTKDNCIFCDRAKDFFKSRDLNYKEYNVIKDSVYLNEMINKSNGRYTMPQIFINEQHIGGFEDLKILIENGKFETIINS